MTTKAARTRNPLSKEEFQSQLAAGSIVHILFTGGGRASPWVVVDVETLLVKHLPTDRKIHLSQQGIGSHQTRVYPDNPNPPLLTYEEFLKVDTKQELCYKKAGDFRYGFRESLSGFQAFRFTSGQMFFPNENSMMFGEYEIWPDVFSEEEEEE